MTEYERDMNNLNKASNLIKGFCAICSKPHHQCDYDCEYGTILKCIDFRKKVLDMFSVEDNHVK